MKITALLCAVGLHSRKPVATYHAQYEYNYFFGLKDGGWICRHCRKRERPAEGGGGWDGTDSA